jgi:putative ABC transport system permease protein
VLTLVVTTLVLFLVALIATASFTVIAHRRLPQLGMMAAVGANEKQLRLTMLMTGAATGAIAAVLGTALGLVGWIAVAPSVGSGVGYRIDALRLPWVLIVAAMLLAIGAATAAAWWPGRTVSRIPPMLALSGRPPAPRPLHRSAVLAIGLLVGGVVCLGLSNTNAQATTGALVLLFVGMVGVVAGILLVCPLAIQAVAKIAARVPVAARLALRDLSRYRARSGAALAAIALALGMAVTVVAAAGAARNNIGPGNLSSTQVLLRGSDLELLTLPDAPAVKSLQQGADAIAAVLPGATAAPLDVAVDPVSQTDPRVPGDAPVGLARPSGDRSYEEIGAVFVATPSLLRAYGLAPSDLAGRDVVTSETGALRLLWTGAPRSSDSEPGEAFVSKGGLPDSFSSLPRVLVNPDQLAARGWRAVPSGQWLIDTARRPTASELEAARVLATQYNLRLETRDSHARLTNISAGAVAVGMLLALAILSMTIGLIRGESMGELRTLTATGATRSTRRVITAVTAAALAALGALLGMAGAYVGLTAGRLSHLLPLPFAELAVIVIGTPLVAGGAGWLFAGREPAAIARRPLD